MVSLNSSQVPSTGAKDACSMKQKRISWILTEKINSSPFSFYAVWFDKYRVGELVFERAFLEVFLDVISSSELFQALFYDNYWCGLYYKPILSDVVGDRHYR